MGVPLRVVIVDDEPIARRRLRRLLGETDSVDVVGEAGDAAAALERVRSTCPDLVLLDVQMPVADGFTVAARLPAPAPLVVFVTAFDRYAVQAFEIHAVDYLLKPVARDRLVEAIARARERLAGRAPAQMIGRIVEALRPPRPLDRVPIRARGRVELVDVGAIDWISAADNYVTLHCGGRSYLLRETLSRFEAGLDPMRFVRVHRSTIVRLDAVVRLASAQRGDYEVTLRDGATVTLSRTYRARFEEAVGRKAR
jgi:two-component system LytT family response regulator